MFSIEFGKHNTDGVIYGFVWTENKFSIVMHNYGICFKYS